MTIEEINKRVDEIRFERADNETAHGLEDDLYYDFVKFVAESNSARFQELAKLLLTTRDIQFERWCA